jgi:hypothetical protein
MGVRLVGARHVDLVVAVLRRFPQVCPGAPADDDDLGDRIWSANYLSAAPGERPPPYRYRAIELPDLESAGGLRYVNNAVWSMRAQCEYCPPELDVVGWLVAAARLLDALLVAMDASPVPSMRACGWSVGEDYDPATAVDEPSAAPGRRPS